LYLFFLSKHENNAIIGLYLKSEQTSAPSSECICKISKIRTHRGLRSSKVIDLGVNRKPMYDFLLIIFISPIKRQQTTHTQIKADRTRTQT